MPETQSDQLLGLPVIELSEDEGLRGDHEHLIPPPATRKNLREAAIGEGSILVIDSSCTASCKKQVGVSSKTMPGNDH